MTTPTQTAIAIYSTSARNLAAQLDAYADRPDLTADERRVLRIARDRINVASALLDAHLEKQDA